MTRRCFTIARSSCAQPQFAEGWNQLGYVLFLAGKYDASLDAIEQTLKLEPMHYAALAGRGIILIQQGKNDGSANRRSSRRWRSIRG